MNALAESQFFAEELQRREYRGLGDTREAARYRLSRKVGGPDSYLKRLRYKAQGMKDVAGSVYKALRDEYERVCILHEAAADRYATERLKIEENHEAHPSNLAAAARVAEAPQSAKEA